MGLRPLYLASGHAWNVIPDGYALRVEGARRAPAWYPFRRLSRVISATDVEWRHGALLASLRAGVPVFFVDGHGNPQGCCYGPSRRETTLDGLLLVAVESLEWESRHRAWRKSVERDLIRQAAEALGVRLRDLAPINAQGTFSNAHHVRLHQPVGPLLRSLIGAVHALTAARLASMISTSLLGHPRPGWCVVDDIAGLLRWPAHATIRFVDGEVLAEQGPGRAAAMLLESVPEVSDALSALLERFEMWLRGWVL